LHRIFLAFSITPFLPDKSITIFSSKFLNKVLIVLLKLPCILLGNLGAIYGKLAAQVFLNKMQNFKAPVDTLQPKKTTYNHKKE
jgi:hypothetical protein